jgi:hypothetical protein
MAAPPAAARAGDAAALRRAAALLEAAAQARACAAARGLQPRRSRADRATALSQLLALPDSATLAAAWFLHRTHAAAPGAMPYDELVSACIFLACKARPLRPTCAFVLARADTAANQVEECPRRTGDVLHACRRAAAKRGPDDPHPLPAVFAIAASAAPPGALPPPLVADAYYCAKDALIAAEAAVLRAIRYDVGAPGEAAPHRLLYNLAATCAAPRPAVRVAAALLRDACLCGAACVGARRTADVAAAGALRAAAALLSLPQLPPPGAADALGLGDEAAVDAAAAELLQAVAARAACWLEDERRAQGAERTDDGPALESHAMS